MIDPSFLLILVPILVYIFAKEDFATAKYVFYNSRIIAITFILLLITPAGIGGFSVPEAFAENNIKQIIKIKGITTEDASSDDYVIHPPLTNVSKAFAWVTFHHTGANDHTDTWKSWEFIDVNTFRLKGDGTPSGNLAVEFVVLIAIGIVKFAIAPVLRSIVS